MQSVTSFKFVLKKHIKNKKMQHVHDSGSDADNDNNNNNQPKLAPGQAKKALSLSTVARKCRRMDPTFFDHYVVQSLQKLRTQMRNDPKGMSLVVDYFDKWYIPAIIKKNNEVQMRDRRQHNHNNNNNNDDDHDNNNHNNNVPLPWSFRHVLNTTPDEQKQYKALINLINSEPTIFQNILHVRQYPGGEDGEGAVSVIVPPAEHDDDDGAFDNLSEDDALDIFKKFCSDNYIMPEEVDLSKWRTETDPKKKKNDDKNNFNVGLVEKILMHYLHSTGCFTVGEAAAQEEKMRHPARNVVADTAPVVPDDQFREDKYLFYFAANASVTPLVAAEGLINLKPETSNEIVDAVRDRNNEANAAANLNVIKKASLLICDTHTVNGKSKIAALQDTNLLGTNNQTTLAKAQQAAKILESLQEIATHNEESWKAYKTAIARALGEYLKSPGTRADVKALALGESKQAEAHSSDSEEDKDQQQQPNNTSPAPKPRRAHQQRLNTVANSNRNAIAICLMGAKNTADIQSQIFVFTRVSRQITLPDPNDEHGIRQSHFKQANAKSIISAVRILLRSNPTVLYPSDRDVANRCNADFEAIANFIKEKQQSPKLSAFLQTYLDIMSEHLETSREHSNSLLNAQLQTLKGDIINEFNVEFEFSQIQQSGQRRSRESDDEEGEQSNNQLLMMTQNSSQAPSNNKKGRKTDESQKKQTKKQTQKK